jgi:hypothetical protein
LLLEDLNTYKNLTSARKPQDGSDSHVSNKLTNNWKIVIDKSRKSNTTYDQLPIPVIPITNGYNALHKLQNNLESPRNIQSHHIMNHHIKKNILLSQNKATSSPMRRKKTILLIGDSHMRGCASELGKYLGPECEVAGTNGGIEITECYETNRK